MMATATQREAPPLMAGDKLSREEFLRRWEAHPEIKKAELIGGLVYMPSPLSVPHGSMDSDVGTWLGVYRAATPGTAGGHNTTSFLLEDTPQPDVYLRVLPECGGKSWVEGLYLSGVPELLTEISLSSVSYDLHVKYDLYHAAGVPEYLAVLLYEKEIRWHVWAKKKYRLLQPDSDGVWRSRVFRGLWLNGAALLEGDLAQVLATLQQGLASSEHRKFVAELSRRRRQA
jgi:hypothetical protein